MSEVCSSSFVAYSHFINQIEKNTIHIKSIATVSDHDHLRFDTE